MAFLKIEGDHISFTLWPGILKALIPAIYRQLPDLTITEITQYLDALGFDNIKESIPANIRRIVEEQSDQIEDNANRIEELDTLRNPRIWAEILFEQFSEQLKVKRHTKGAKSLKTLDKALHNPYFKELLFKLLERHGFKVTESGLTKELREIIGDK